MKVPAYNCLGCGSTLDAATDPLGDGTPASGDMTICLYCGHLMAFGDDLALRELTGAEMIEVAGDKKILAIQAAAAAARKEIG